MFRSIVISTSLFLALAPGLFAQGPANWDRVKQLGAGERIRVTLSDHRVLRGELQSTTDDALMVSTRKSQETLSRAMISKVSVRGPDHRNRNALIGLGAGAGVGFTIGAIDDHEARCKSNGGFQLFCGTSLGKVAFTPTGGLVGLIVGFVIPTGRWHEVFRAQ